MINIQSINSERLKMLIKEEMKYTSRMHAEAVNQHAYYIARNATQTTKAAEKEKIRSDLMKSSKEYPGVPLAAILVNAERGKQGKFGLNGNKMLVAMESFIKRMIAHRNFLRSGWIPAIKKLALVVQKKGGIAIPSGTNKPGRNYGGAKAAKVPIFISINPFALIWNSATGKGKSSDRSRKYIEDGAKAAMRMEMKNLIRYIRKKREERKKKYQQ